MESVLPSRSLEPLRCSEKPGTLNQEARQGKGYKIVNGLLLSAWALEPSSGPEVDLLLTEDAIPRLASYTGLVPQCPLIHCF